MSDEKELFDIMDEQIEKGNRERIKELEQKLSDFIDTTCTRHSDNAHIDNHNERLNTHWKKIEALEKETELMNSDWTQMDTMLNKIKEEISELKKRREFHRDANNKAFLNLSNIILNNRDVLREFLEYIKDDYDDGEKIYDKLIKKLEGENAGSARQTEGNWNPTLGDGLPEDARFPATDSISDQIFKEFNNNPELTHKLVRKEDLQTFDDKIKHELTNLNDAMKSLFEIRDAWNVFKERYLSEEEHDGG